MIKSPYNPRRLKVGCEPKEVANRLRVMLLDRGVGGGAFVLGVVATNRGQQWVMTRTYTELAERIQLDLDSHVGTYSRTSTAKEIREDVLHWMKPQARAA